jgi:1-phosphatidylinositol-5-phosphate 4-kinase
MEGQSKTKTKRFKVKHPKRKLFRASEPLLSVFMWGVNHSVRELQHVHAPVMLMPDDFRSFSKIKIDNYAFNKENLPSHFKVKEYCPLVFRNLRERFGIADEDFLSSLIKCPKPMDAHKSGAKCYLSYDGIYVINTLTTDQVEEMHCYLKHYHPYVVERHGKTLLPQYLAMYRLTVDNIETYMVVMRNVFSAHMRVHKKYDLKGSTVDREASEKEREKSLPTLKDNDFLVDQLKIYIGEEAKEKLLETLAADAEFLARLNIMDYSLLLGIHDLDLGAEEEDEVQEMAEEEEDEDEYDSGGSGGNALTPPDSPGSPRHRLSEQRSTFRRANSSVNGGINPDKDIYAIPSRPGPGNSERNVYFLSIVDVLTHYGMKKAAAKAAKTMKYGSSVEGISTVEPEQYAKRFIAFIADAIE